MAHNDYRQTAEESAGNLQEWTRPGHRFYLIEAGLGFIGFVHLGNRGGGIDWLEDLSVPITIRKDFR